MNFWKFFKSETTEERIDRSMANVKERVERGLRAGISYMDLYNTEMNNLGSLEDDIVSPPFYKIKKDSYRNKQLQVLQGTMAECMSYFSNNIDDRLNEAILFRKNMIDDRDRTLDTISRMGRAEALKNMNDDGNKVGSDTNPGAFRIENSIARKFAAQRNNGSVSLKFIEENIKDDVKKALDAFEPQEVWKQQFEAGSWKEEYDDSKRQYDDLKEIINANYEGDDNRMQLKWLAIKLKLTENENSSICDVLRQKDIDGIGASGLDFMVERHPDILADVMVHKLLTKMQHNSSEIIQRLRDDIDIQSLLNPKGYVDLIAQERALSSVMGELSLLQPGLVQEFEQYRNDKIPKMVDEHTRAISSRIMQGFLDGKKIEDTYENEMKVMLEIRNKIIEPGENVEDKDGFRKMQMQILEGMIQKCEDYFGDDIRADERICSTLFFLEEMRKGGFLEAMHRSGMGADKYLKIKMSLVRASDKFSGPSWSDKRLNAVIKKYNDENLTLNEFRGFVLNKAEDAMQEYSPDDVLSNKVKSKCKEKCESCLVNWKSVNGLEDLCMWNVPHEITTIRKAVDSLKMCEDLRNTFPGIFDQESRSKGSTGLDFLLERNRDLLVYMLLYKMLNNYDESVLELVRDKKDITLLNLPKYMELYTKKKTLWLVVSQYPSLNSELKQQYEKFREEKTIEESVKNMNERICEAVGKGTDIKEIYDEEMKRIADSQKTIVELAQKDKNVDVEVRTLKRQIEECVRCFAKNMDDRLYEAEIFISNVDALHEKYRNEFLKQVGERGLEKFLYENNDKRVGSDINPGIFQLQNIIDDRFKGKNEQQNNLIEFMEGDVHENVKNFIEGFEPWGIRDVGIFTDLSRHYDFLRNIIINDDYGEGSKKALWMLAKMFKLDEDRDSSIGGILQKRETSGYSGLDFMIECHPRILADVMVYKVLKDMDKVYLTQYVIERNDLALLKSNVYLNLYARKKALSSFTDRLAQLTDDLKSGYEKFKPCTEIEQSKTGKGLDKEYEKLLNDQFSDWVNKEKENIDKETVVRVENGLFDTHNVDQVYDREMKKLDELQEYVVVQGVTVRNSDQFMLDIQKLKYSVDACSKCFSLKMDKRLLAAQIFVQNVCNDDNKEKRDEFLRSLSNLDKKQRMEYLLKIQVQDKEEQHNEQDIDHDIVLAMSKYDPKEILNLDSGYWEADFDDYFAAYEALANMLGKPITDQGESIRKLAETIEAGCFDSKDNTFLLKQGESQLAVGWKFMAEHHPDILLYEMLEETLSKIDYELLENLYLDIVDGRYSLNSAEYMNLYARKKALSRVTEEIWQNRSQLLEEYRAFESKGKKSSLKQKNLKRKNLSEQEISELKTKTDETYKEFSKFWDGKKENENFAEGFDDAFNATCKAHFELISRNLKGKISLTDEEHALVDSHMGEIIKAMRYVRVDSNQSNTCTTKFFNAIGWSSHKLRIGKKANQNNQYPKKMFYTISPSREIKAQEMVKQLIGKGDYLGQHYSKRNDIGEGFYAWAANPDMKVDGAEETSSNTSWSDGRQKGSVQFTIALNKRAKIIDNEQVGEKMSDFKEKFPNTYASSKSYGKDEKKFQSIFLAFMGYNVNRMKAADESGGIDCYCITDPKVITMDPTIAVRVGAGRKVNMQRPVIASRELEEYLA